MRSILNVPSQRLSSCSLEAAIGKISRLAARIEAVEQAVARRRAPSDHAFSSSAAFNARCEAKLRASKLWRQDYTFAPPGLEQPVVWLHKSPDCFTLAWC